MRKKPVIGISTSTILEVNPVFPGYERTYVADDYNRSVIAAGGIPIMIPITENKEVLEEHVKLCDALILSGGHDVNPYLYGQEPKQKLGDIYPKRDRFEMTLLEWADKYKIPVLGICRGMQLMNVYYGGSLHQDLSYHSEELLKHNQNQTVELETHLINTVPNTFIGKVLGEVLMVNSFHHQAIDQLAPSFIISAYTNDSCVESIEKEGELFRVGVQWHPEMLSKQNVAMQKLFKEFIKESKKEAA
ncbi:gamma-glutamyl-gamma-aminobutyrate hydrolase family protein [Erysipelothrix urinaevulpis]|uniref:gamma-glutamyl-gamma-aminobutyrate hydrolase family protein n=1 Tax=Erysipelothrix urinaevulpis TaxID=2683717 RepID=UPI001357B9E6|nr:gamma-glutamyl-gamma-aminobutyrate hydrolase family protein [Erysipelothrix urinaevulpis]